MLKFDERGLVPAIIQDANTGDVLMLAYMNEDSLRRTIDTGETWFWSRSRSELWHKGETSGNTQTVLSVAADCDADTVLVSVRPHGPACHKGFRSCFHQFVYGDNRKERGTPHLEEQLEQLYDLIERRRDERPEGSYTTYLFNKGLDKILKKLGEETAETIIAAKNPEHEKFVGEVSDLLYHLLVLLVERGVGLNEIGSELARRANAVEK